MNTEFRRICRTVLAGTGAACLLAGIPAAVQAQAIDSSTKLYKAIRYNGATPGDPRTDQQTGQNNASTEADLVGNGDTNPFFYVAFYDGGTALNLTDGTLFFRARVAGDDPTLGQFKGSLNVGIDANADGKLDIFTGVNNSGQSNVIYISRTGDGANTSPSTTTIDHTDRPQAQPTYATSSTNYLFRQLDSTIAPDVTTFDYNVLADGTTATGDTSGVDFFIGFAVPFNDLVTHLQTITGISINDETQLRFVVGTSNQGNAFNQDLGGSAGNTTSTATFASLGVVSDPVSASSFEMPEPGTLGLLGTPLTGLGLGVRLRRRRRAE